MKKIQVSIIVALLFISVKVYSQPQFPCAPGTQCPPAPALCSQQSDCIPSDPEPPVGDAIPLDGASSILLAIGLGLSIYKRVKQAKYNW